MLKRSQRGNEAQIKDLLKVTPKSPDSISKLRFRIPLLGANTCCHIINSPPTLKKTKSEGGKSRHTGVLWGSNTTPLK
jgi:hypothetical protein